jgi:hypothetical protein
LADAPPARHPRRHAPPPRSPSSDRLRPTLPVAGAPPSARTSARRLGTRWAFPRPAQMVSHRETICGPVDTPGLPSSAAPTSRTTVGAGSPQSGRTADGGAGLPTSSRTAGSRRTAGCGAGRHSIPGRWQFCPDRLPVSGYQHRSLSAVVERDRWWSIRIAGSRVGSSAVQPDRPTSRIAGCGAGWHPIPDCCQVRPGRVWPPARPACRSRRGIPLLVESSGKPPVLGCRDPEAGRSLPLESG